jgi:hypothetical protein
MLIKIMAQSDFESFFQYGLKKLCGSETFYPESLQKALINTFIDKNVKYFCFQINKICLYPKYTFDDNEIFAMTENKYIVIADEMYYKYFLPDRYDISYNLDIIYNLPSVDMIKLKRTEGDFPQDGSIDKLLTEYLENSIVINYGQEFTLYFDCNDMVNSKNYITFSIQEITYQNKIEKNIQNRLEEMNLTLEFNKNINNINEIIGIDKCENHVYNFSWLYSTSKISDDQKKNIGIVVNNEVKIDFIVSEPSPKPIKNIDIVTHQIQCPNNNNANNNTNNNAVTNIFDSPGLKCDDTNQTQKILTKEELRQKRLQAFSFINVSTDNNSINEI